MMLTKLYRHYVSAGDTYTHTYTYTHIYTCTQIHTYKHDY